MASGADYTVILGTGGTIAGQGEEPGAALRYRAAQIGAAALVQAVPALRGLPLQAEQVAQVDSKDMNAEVWVALLGSVERHLARDEVSGVVVTHGTDTLEETAYLLHRLISSPKPVVLTAAMRPATALQADGPQNLLDAVAVARAPGARGVLVVMAGTVFHPEALRKAHTWRLDAFSAGDGGPVAHIVDGALRRYREWPEASPDARPAWPDAGTCWPRVEIVTSHAGADGRVIELLCGDGAEGLVLAGTGNGTLAEPLEKAARAAQASGVRVLRASRCAGGAVLGGEEGGLASAGALSPAQARIALMLELLKARQAGS
jgi:L-asparaginase